MARPRKLALLIALVLGVGLVPSVSEARPAAARLLAGPGYHEPAVGSCYNLTWDQAAKQSSTKDPVPCDAPHTLMTVKVKRLAKPVNWSSDNLAARFSVACHKALYETLGGSTKLAAMSAYDFWWFIPTEKERAKGARWVRCDAGLLAGRTGMDSLPASVDLGSLPLPNKIARCLVGRYLATTACSNGHDWRAKGAFKLSFRPRTKEQYFKQGRRCPHLTNSRRYAFDGPSAEQWKAGHHWMVCFKPE